jgi:internalin A
VVASEGVPGIVSTALVNNAEKLSKEPAAKPEYFVSYAWGDSTPEGKERELIVDQFCAAAEKCGVTIVRDKHVLGLGDRISEFIQGRGNCVFIVLSDKYLRSPYCMNELYEVWRNCRQDDKEFLRHVMIYTLPETAIRELYDKLEWAVFWMKKCAKVEEAIAKVGLESGLGLLGKTGGQEYFLMKEFSVHVVDILKTVTDVIQPHNFEELKNYAFPVVKRRHLKLTHDS